MSALAGIYSWDGRPVSEADLTPIAAACRPAGDNERIVYVKPGVSLYANVLHFDPHSAGERQPHRVANGSILTFDGRLDNRDDLLVNLRRHVPADPSDVVLVGAAYERWGLERTLLLLLGDWTFALWDESKQQLVIARDYMGARPIFYRVLRDGLAWATSLNALTVDHPDCPPPNESYIAGELTTSTPPDMTPYQGVHALRAGHVLIASRSTGINVRRFWTFTPSRIRYQNPQTYIEHLRELLVEAVRVRLRTTSAVWSHLSGGWDSSSVVCLSHALIQSRLVTAKAVHPISIVSTRSPESDESDYISAVERWCGLTSRRYDLETYPTLETLIARRTPMRWVPLEAPVAEAGDRIVLTGDLGDLVMGQGQRQAMLEPLYEGRPFETFRLCVQRSKAKRRPLLLTIAQLGLLSYAPPRVMRVVSRWEQWGEPGQLKKESASTPQERYGVTPTLFDKVPDHTPDHPSQAPFPMVKRYLVSRLYHVADHASRIELPLDISTWRTAPYSHRPLVEYMLGTPTLAFWNPRGGPRLGMQRALAEILPPEILARSTKGNPSAVLARAHQEWGAALADVDGLTAATVADWEIVRRGYVDGAALACDMTNWQNKSPSQPVTKLADCIYIEAWLRSLSRHAVTSSRGPALDTPVLSEC